MCQKGRLLGMGEHQKCATKSSMAEFLATNDMEAVETESSLWAASFCVWVPCAPRPASDG